MSPPARTRQAAAALALLALGAGCAQPLRKIYPGMTRQQVVETMERAPERTELFEDACSAWYYGEDRCLLFHEDVVVAKQRSEVRTQVSTPIGSVREELNAQCLPPGGVRPPRVERQVDVHLPEGIDVDVRGEGTAGQQGPAGDSGQD